MIYDLVKKIADFNLNRFYIVHQSGIYTYRHTHTKAILMQHATVLHLVQKLINTQYAQQTNIFQPITSTHRGGSNF